MPDIFCKEFGNRLYHSRFTLALIIRISFVSIFIGLSNIFSTICFFHLTTKRINSLLSYESAESRWLIKE